MTSRLTIKKLNEEINILRQKIDNMAKKMIMILNAAHKCPSVGQFFPPFVSRHYSYLRDVYPKLVPLLTFMEVGSAQSSRDEAR